MDYLVTVGHDVRRWSKFKVTDVTDAERLVLDQGGEAGLRLLQALEESERAEVETWDDDECPDPFLAEASPDIIDTAEY